MKSSNPVEVISANFLYGQVTNDPVPLALFVTLAARSSEVLPSFSPIPSFSYSESSRQLFFHLFVQRKAAHFVRVKDEEHPKNLTSHLYTFTKVMHRRHITILFCTTLIFLGYAIQSATKLVN